MAPLGRIPEATVARLPLYLRGLDAPRRGDGNGVVRRTRRSRRCQRRQGPQGPVAPRHLRHRGVGYDAAFLRFQISQALGVANVWPVVVCGMGNLGRALANHTGFTDRGFPVVAATDSDPDKIGTVVDGVPVHAPANSATSSAASASPSA